MGQQIQNGQVDKIDLDLRLAAHATNANYVELTGRLARNYVSAYEERGIIHIFVPVVHHNWKATDDVQAFVHCTTSALPNGRPKWPDLFRSTGPIEIPGKVGGRLPVFAEKEFTSKGLKFGRSYFVVDWTPFPDRKIPVSYGYVWALGIGLWATAVVFVVLSLIKMGKLPLGRVEVR